MAKHVRGSTSTHEEWVGGVECGVCVCGGRTRVRLGGGVCSTYLCNGWGGVWGVCFWWVYVCMSRWWGVFYVLVWWC